jgi:DNA-binding transcriptional MocR family regulator
VLLFGYKCLGDSAKLTYQVIDSFDWSDGAGLRKGYAYPSIRRLAEIRGVDERTIQRHLAQLEEVGLLSRKDRPGRPNLLIIEDPSPVETQRYLAAFGGGEKGDKYVTPTPDKNVTPHLEEDKEQERQTSLTRLEKASEVERRNHADPVPVAELVRPRLAALRMSARKSLPPECAKREYLAQQMLNVLRDEHSLGFYRRVAERCSPASIFRVLGTVKEVAQNGRVRTTRGAIC